MIEVFNITYLNICKLSGSEGSESGLNGDNHANFNLIKTKVLQN